MAIRILWTAEWSNDLNGCPSQLCRKFINPFTGEEDELYCRWRHNNPWTFEIIPQSGDFIFLGTGFTEQEMVEQLHEYAEFLLREYLKNPEKFTSDDEEDDDQITFPLF